MVEIDQNIDRTTEEGLCTSCGICAAVCPVSCIHYKREKETYLPVIDYKKCIQCGKCLKICPGYSYTYKDEKINEPNCLSVQTKNKRILKNASSGGLVTTMVQKLLQDEQYKVAFLVLDYNYDKQIETKAFYKGDNLQNSQQSRYLPVSQEKAVKYILENPTEKVIFVGTSCAVHGLCNVLKETGRNRENILVLGLFCDQIMTYSIYEYLKRLKSWNRPIKALHFRDKRAGGWPGNLRIEFCDRTYVHVHARERALVKDFCRQKRCLYCIDKLNAEADLSAGDNYTQKDCSKEGSSSLIIRTTLGQQVWEYCHKEFFAFGSDYSDIKESQHVDRRLKTQWINNLVFAEKHRGKKVEYGLPCDLVSFNISKVRVTKKNRKQHKKQLSALVLGEKRAYKLIRRKRFIEFGKMSCSWLLAKLYFRRKIVMEK